MCVFAEEIGDYDAELHHGDYVAGVKLVLRQTDQLNQKVIELHQKRDQGQEPHIVIDEFMSIARELETYGVDPHPVKVWVTHRTETRGECLVIWAEARTNHEPHSAGSPRDTVVSRHQSLRHQYVCGRPQGAALPLVGDPEAELRG